MRSQIFYPPEAQTFNEDVIGSVVQRKWSLRHSYTAGIDSTDQSRWQRDSSEDDEMACVGSKLSPSDEYVQTSNPFRAKLSISEIGAVIDPVTLKTLRALQNKKRERRRISQQRYMQKKSRAAASLENYMPLLRDEVSQLLIRRDHLLRSREILWSAAVEYFSIFEHGLSSSKGLPPKSVKYLRTVLALDVDTGITSGFESLMACWRIFTLFFPDVHVKLKGLRSIAKHSLVASTFTTITLTKQSLQKVFPQLVDESKGQDSHRRKRIISQLLGQRIVMKGSARFHWDNTSKRVDILYSHLDMVSPLLQLLSDIEDVSLIFRGALITPAGNIMEP
ncbi:Protein kinase [Phytophthora cinnamomi]|uniref:Protein kinase n=1 Tax=Phytophthora cinnamomi TaxID=4785 RepID=UPI00355AC56F|nr:Protein kinase [Phytophthora cinnamomi]